MKRPASLVDGSAVLQRRLEAGLSRNAVAATSGLSPRIVKRVEGGDPRADDMLTVADLIALADALGVSPSTLLTRSTVPEPLQDASPDAATLGAVLHTAGRQLSRAALRSALGWSSQRLEQAATELSVAAPAAGAHLYLGAQQLRLAPIKDEVVIQALESEKRQRAHAYGMDAAAARVLQRVANGATLATGRIGTNTRIALAQLALIGAVEVHKSGAHLSEATLLALQPEGATHRQKRPMSSKSHSSVAKQSSSPSHGERRR
jgi:transcriptional regulator with XRE-family HTH domain